MNRTVERRLLQVVIALVLALPVTAAVAGIAGGPRFLGQPPLVPTDLDSHFRYLSGIFAAMLIGYASCIPAIERRGARLRLLVALTVAGGLARLVSLIAVGVPSTGHVAGLAIELGVAPMMLMWQGRVARRYGTT